jgi:hypothetical protein
LLLLLLLLLDTMFFGFTAHMSDNTGNTGIPALLLGIFLFFCNFPLIVSFLCWGEVVGSIEKVYHIFLVLEQAVPAVCYYY